MASGENIPARTTASTTETHRPVHVSATKRRRWRSSCKKEYSRVSCPLCQRHGRGTIARAGRRRVRLSAPDSSVHLYIRSLQGSRSRRSQPPGGKGRGGFCGIFCELGNRVSARRGQGSRHTKCEQHAGPFPRYRSKNNPRKQCLNSGNATFGLRKRTPGPAE